MKDITRTIMTVTNGSAFKAAVADINDSTIISDVHNIREHYALCTPLRRVLGHTTFQVTVSRPELLVYIGVRYHKILYIKNPEIQIEDLL